MPAPSQAWARPAGPDYAPTMDGGRSVRHGRSPSGARGRTDLDAAQEYADAGRIDDLVDLLRDQDQLAELPALLARVPPAELGTTDLIALSATLSTPAAAAAPAADRTRAHLLLARTASYRGETSTQSEQIDVAADLAGSDPTLLRAVAAERLDVAVRTATEVEAIEALIAQCSDQIDHCPDEETRTGAVLRLVRARAGAWLAEDQTLQVARRDAPEAAGLFHALGDDLGRLRSLLILGWGVLPQLGQLDRAIERLRAAADLAPPSSPQRAEIGVYLAELQTLVGADTDAAATLAEVLACAGIPDVTIGYAAWERASLAFEHREHDQVRRWVAHARRFAGDWYGARAGAAFDCSVAEWAAELRWPDAPDLLARARDQVADHGYPAQLWMAEACAAMAAGRWDSAAEHLQAWLEEGSTGHDWRCLLRLAWVELQRANPGRARELTRQAVEIADSVGHPEVIALREPQRWAALSVLTTAAEASLELRVLGEVCVVTAGVPVRVTGDKPRQLLAALAVLDRPVRVGEASELLWPGVEAEVGRRRLRNVLARIRTHGDLVVRDDDLIRLSGAIPTDVGRFSAAAERLLRAGIGTDADVELARDLVTRFGSGPRFEPDEILPDAAAALARLQRLAVGVHRMLAEHLAGVGLLDEAISVAERWARLDPYDPEPSQWAETQQAQSKTPPPTDAPWPDRPTRPGHGPTS